MTSKTAEVVYDEARVLHDLKHYLPGQMTLKDFVHHNTLHPFQNQKFYDGIFRASELFGYKVTLQLNDFRRLYKLGRIKEHVIDRVVLDRKGSSLSKEWIEKMLFTSYDEQIKARTGQFRQEWKKQYKIDLDSMVHPLFFRILCAYLDQGISIWNFPEHEGGFYESVKQLELESGVSFFETKKVKKIFHNEDKSIEDLLKILVGDEAYFEQYLFDMSFSHRGWSGIVAVIDEMPEALLIRKKITLAQIIRFELLMELDQVYLQLGDHWQPLAVNSKTPPTKILGPTPSTELHEILTLWQDAFEWSYYDDVLKGIKTNLLKDNEVAKPSFQAIFCIDDRECSIRRHIEFVDPVCETLGAPGFFGIEFYFKQIGAKFGDKLCPAPVTPKYLIKEYGVEYHGHNDRMFDEGTHSLNPLKNLGLGLLALPELARTLFRPKMKPSISDAFAHMTKRSKLTVINKNIEDKEDGLQIGFTLTEICDRIEKFLLGIGLTKTFSPIVYMVAHGSSSANNPHHGAHDCGACSGRPGFTNARVFAFAANLPEVRKELSNRGIQIPESTFFIGAMHDTAADTIQYYLEEDLPSAFQSLHDDVVNKFEDALDLNAKERSRRFSSIDTNRDIKKVRKDILDRSVSIFEPRPELGHGTNSLCIVGRRSITKDLMLDRRAFLNSYDYRTDLDGTYLANVMAPIGVVCGGINLEYYFSRVDNVKLGCGTKLPHNVMGLIGVSNSSDGDLRPGLPWQMIEPHDPVRLMVIVEHFPEVLLKVIQSSEAMYEWYKNEWVHITALHPETGEFYYYQNGHFNHYHAEVANLEVVTDLHSLFEKAPEMITNHITDATFENLPIYQIESNVSCQ
ncbi:MAG: hypothetical protein ACI9IP_002126 [Arcticibacterium sp.]|jgi:uncharacterized protein YbcC (UPF0753/DUF2309 family)